MVQITITHHTHVSCVRIIYFAQGEIEIEGTQYEVRDIQKRLSFGIWSKNPGRYTDYFLEHIHSIYHVQYCVTDFRREKRHLISSNPDEEVVPITASLLLN